MRKFKTFITLIVVIFIALVIYQNRSYFFTKQALSLSLGVESWQWTAPEVENVYLFGGCFLFGILITGYMGIMSKFKSRRIIKGLNATINTHLQTVETLHMELDKFKKDAAIQSSPPDQRDANAVDRKTRDDSADKKSGETETVIELPGEPASSKA